MTFAGKNRGKKKLFVYAYTEANLGDDLLIRALCGRYPDARFYLMCRKANAGALRAIPNLTVFPPVRGLDMLRKILKKDVPANAWLQRLVSGRCDGIVQVGGSIFMNRPGWEKWLADYEKYRLLPGKPFYILGCNSGPSFDGEFVEAHLRLFSKVTDVCFRDKTSYRAFKRLPNARFAPDLAFAGNRLPPAAAPERPYAVVSVILLETRRRLREYQAQYQQTMARVVLALNDRGLDAVLMAFCVGEGDAAAAERLAEVIRAERPGARYRQHVYRGNVDEAARLVAGSTAVVATRFHAMVLGWLFGKPVLPVVYDEKMDQALEDVAYGGPVLRLDNLGAQDAGQAADRLLASVPLDVSDTVRQAAGAFEKLDAWVLGEEPRR